MSTIAAAEHHGSHRDLLLTSTGPVARSAVDAIVVPTVRRHRHLLHAVRLSHALHCPLLVLCSGPYTGTRRLRPLAGLGAEVVVVDFPGVHAFRIPRLETSAVLPPRFRRRADTAAKRNLALVLARMLSWERVVFLDDDIEVEDPDDLRRAAGLLGSFSAVGLHLAGFPDNSVVCHAYRAVGGAQDSFVGGGALVVETGPEAGFFPDIYNEDWFYLLDGERLRALSVTGTVRQAPYDPFRTPERARSEELGDVLAEGVFWLLDEGRTIDDAHYEYWSDFLTRRRRFILEVLHRIPEASQVNMADKARMTEALRASLGRLALITPGLCLAYMDAWRADRKSWGDFVRLLPPAVTAEEALLRLTAPGQKPPSMLRLPPTTD
ncbi:hypothetical protein [Nonomuraea sp. NPDC050691]|uniref:hypothetical protein n=1 Tax=Nonomuraea sp. NPDC050691 TaxID=3155661 RepID=UPI0033D16B97